MMEKLLQMLRPPKKPVPDPFDVQANALKPLMGPGDLIPEYVEDRTGSPALGFAAGFINPAGMLRKKPPMRSEMITKGGDPNLLLSHTANPGELSSLLRYGSERALTAPSLAISKQAKPFGDGVQMFPYPQKLDPATNSRVDLYNTDIYTYRRGHDRLEAPYASKRLRKNPKLVEGAEPTDAQMLSILAAPRFSSLQEFEDATEGGFKLAKDGLPIDHSASEEVLAQMIDWMATKNPMVKPSYAVVANLRPATKQRLMQQFLAENPTAARVLNQAPQAYGEMKLHGKLPIDRANIAAMRITDPSAVSPRMIKELQRTGIPLVPQHLTTQEQIAGYVDSLTGLRKRPQETIYDFAKEGPAYLDKFDEWKI